MQTGKSAMATALEKAENVAASANSGMEKTKATAQEKIDKMRANDLEDKKAAEQRKETRKQEAEKSKQSTMEENASVREARGGTGNAGVIDGEHHHSTLDHGTDVDAVARSPIKGEENLTGAAGHETGVRDD